VKKLDAGKMRFRVVIQRPSPTQGATGQPITAWITFANRRAAKTVDSGLETMAAQQRIARNPVTWILRPLAGVDPAMRLVSGGKVYEIISIPDDGMGNETRINTLERVGEIP